MLNWERKQAAWLGLVRLWGVVLISLWAVETVKANDSVLVYGFDAKGEDVLATVTLPANAFTTPIANPDNPNGTRVGNPESLKFTIVARGVSHPMQGADDSVLYCKGAILWRYHKGAYRHTVSGPPMQENGKAIESSKNLGLLAFPQSGSNLDRPEVGIYAFILKIGGKEKIEVALAPQDTGQEPVAWLHDGRLLAREFQLDKIGRLKANKFWILNAAPLDKNDAPTEPLTRTPLTDLGPPTIELAAGVASGKVAVQVFDEETGKFRLGICRLAQKKDANNVIEWLPMPPGRTPNYYLGEFSKPVSHLGWNPDGRYLHFGAHLSGVWIWDDKERAWLKRIYPTNNNSVEYILYDRNEFKPLWLDADRFVSSEYHPFAGSILQVGRISEFSRKMTMAGQLDNLWVKEIFRIKMAN